MSTVLPANHSESACVGTLGVSYNDHCLTILTQFCCFGLPNFSCSAYCIKNFQISKLFFCDFTAQFPQKFGTGALRDILLNSPSVDRRVEAITSISRLPRAQRIAFYKMALRDSSDDVRLLAYSQLDPIEQQITDNIKILAEGFKSNENADTAFDIAQQFWELCYLGISEGALFNHYIQKALEWCETAIRLDAKPNYSLLLGKIYLSLDKNDLAYEALNKAYRSKMLSSQVLPYLAECAFKKHEYAKVKELLKELGSAGAGKLTQIKEYWCETVH